MASNKLALAHNINWSLHNPVAAILLSALPTMAAFKCVETVSAIQFTITCRFLVRYHIERQMHTVGFKSKLHCCSMVYSNDSSDVAALIQAHHFKADLNLAGKH
jgi:hypothetical protein